MTDLSDGVVPRPGGGHRRLLTLLFADLSGSTRLAEAMEAEHYALMLSGLRRCYQEEVARHGGQVVRIQGDGLLAIFGHPMPREDEGRRACECALALHEAVRALPVQGGPAWAQQLSLHSGVHAGMVLMDEGDEVRGRFELLGHAPSIAARLSELAGADEIVASVETLGPHQHFFRTSTPRLVELKGRSEPLAVLSVCGRAALARRFDASVQRGLSPFVGRETELALLDATLEQAVAGRAGWVDLSAPAGVGKTRLTEEFLRRASGRGTFRVLRGYCENDLSAEPLQPFMQMLRSLPAGEPVSTVHASAPHRRGDALLALLDAHAREHPVLLAIDDLQWADDASLALVHRLIGHAGQQGLPLMLVTTSRPQAHGHLPAAAGGVARQLDLQPFSDAEATAAIAQLLPSTDPFVTAEIQRHAGGNALFIEELCHAMAGQRPTGLDAPVGSAWLGALIESRLTRLPPRQAAVLRAAAVIGNVIPLWLLASLTGLEATDPAVHALAEQDFVYPSGNGEELRFKHGVTHEVVYQAIGLHERQDLHRRAAQALRARADAGGPAASHELLAYHDGAAGNWARAADHAEAAGDQAIAASALDRAKKQFRAALASLEYLPDGEPRRLRWIAIAQRFGLACVFDGSRADMRVLRHAVQLAHSQPEPSLRARADYWFGYVSYALGDARPSVEHCQRGLAQAEELGDAALIAQLRGALGQAHAAASEYAPATLLLDEAIMSQRAALQAHRRAGRSSGRTPVGLAYSLACRGAVAGDLGRFDLARELFGEALEQVTGTGHPVEASVQGLYAAILLWQGSWAEAQLAAGEAHRIGARVRSLFTFSMGRAAGAYGAWREHRDKDALAIVQEATAWLAPRGGGLFNSWNQGWLAEMLAEEGDAARARHHIAQALRRGRLSDWLGGAMAYRAAARLAPDEAGKRRYLGRARCVAARRGSAHDEAVNNLCAAELLRDRAALDAAEQAFERMNMPGHLARAREVRATF
ncbi:MAG: AAA family ATPase [Paucibacter sp.]|nr:AAA family ATPase [Roseateles sp.]